MQRVQNTRAGTPTRGSLPTEQEQAALLSGADAQELGLTAEQVQGSEAKTAATEAEAEKIANEAIQRIEALETRTANRLSTGRNRCYHRSRKRCERDRNDDY